MLQACLSLPMPTAPFGRGKRQKVAGEAEALAPDNDLSDHIVRDMQDALEKGAVWCSPVLSQFGPDLALRYTGAEGHDDMSNRAVITNEAV